MFFVIVHHHVGSVFLAFVVPPAHQIFASGLVYMLLDFLFFRCWKPVLFGFILLIVYFEEFVEIYLRDFSMLMYDKS